MSQKGFVPVLVLILVAVITLGGYFAYQNVNKTNSTPPPNQVACTQDTKLCPDGTSVGRVGPKCEFAPCPTPKESTPSADMSNWKIYTSNLIGVELKLPSTWTASEKDEKVNKYIEIKSPNNDTEVVIFKNYLGGAAGFKKYKENKEVQIVEIKTMKSYFTEDTDPQNISMFINLDRNKDKYLIIGKWKINDIISEGLINQILSTFKFLP